MSHVLLASSFIDEQRLRDHLGRSAGGEDDLDQRLVRACNRSVAWMEKRVARRLRARNYRTAFTVTTSAQAASGADSVVLTSATGVKVGDDMVAAGLAVGTQVGALSGTTVTLSRETAAVVSSGATLTLGSKPLVWMNEVASSPDLYCPEYPLREANLYALYWVDDDGVRWACDMTAVQVDEVAGRISLKRELGGLKEGRYEFECRAGYEQPSETDLGDPEDWEALSSIQLRVAEVYFLDDSHLKGRASTVSVGAVSLTSADLLMPADIEAALLPYRRLVP